MHQDAGAGWEQERVHNKLYLKNEGRSSNRSFQFTGKQCAKVMPSDPASPIIILKTFIGDHLLEKIVEYTNTYGNILQNNPKIQEQIKTEDL